MKESSCKSCGAAIVWIKTPSGKSMPCNVSPVYYIEKPRSGTKRVVLQNGEVLACEFTKDPGKAIGGKRLMRLWDYVNEYSEAIVKKEISAADLIKSLQDEGYNITFGGNDRE